MRHTNEHSDLSTEEFNRIFNGFRRAVQPKAAKSSDKSVKPPKSLDYSSKGYVTPGEICKRLKTRSLTLSFSSKTGNMRQLLELFSHRCH